MLVNIVNSFVRKKVLLTYFTHLLTYKVGMQHEIHEFHE